MAGSPLSAGTLRADSLSADSLSADSLGVDTLREVTVRAGRHIPLPGMVVSPGLKEAVVPPPSLSSVLEKLSPGINDKITHPFAIKQRKKERRRKRSLKALEDFDKVKTFDELLHEAYRRQMHEDSVQRAISDQSGDNN
ncbi:MAG: hypothetical protein J6I36_06120 [Bacteroidaceae bacterium]|nr:hypothetical protein [Bacteroidaceae bacterium]